MIMQAVSWYFETVSAFWVSLAGSGLFKLILIWCLISWFCGHRRMRWRCHGHSCRCRCTQCGCRCGHCPCGGGDGKDEEVE